MFEARGGLRDADIRRELDKAIDDWLSVVEDEELREMFRESVFVAGGAIASMLLGEDRSDLDLYFKSEEVAKKAQLFYSRLEKKDRYHEVARTPSAVSLAGGVQIITRFCGGPEKVVREFDFEHCRVFYDVAEHYLSIPAAALRALLARDVVYVGSRYPFASFLRMLKFKGRGWKCSASSALLVAYDVAMLDMGDADALADQITGVDIAVLGGLVSMLGARDADLGKVTREELVSLMAESAAVAEGAEPKGDHACPVRRNGD